MTTKDELLQVLRPRYSAATRPEKGLILDEFVALSGCHRKHAIRQLSRAAPGSKERDGRKVYGEAVRQVLVVIWEASDRLCGKRLKVMLPVLVDALERHGHLALDDELRERLHAVSPATIDRLLAPVRKKAGSGAGRDQRPPFAAASRFGPSPTGGHRRLASSRPTSSATTAAPWPARSCTASW